MSFSAYKKLNLPNRLKFLEIIVEHYLSCRHDAYMSHGYSATTIQVRKDFAKHKKQGGLANKKIKKICEELGYKPVPQGKTIGELERMYCFIDQKQGKKSLLGLEKKGESWYRKWSKNHEGKQADFLFSGNKEKYFICEAKHIKESGGGQDKQINELIAFINNKDHKQKFNNIFYIAFLDGVYFNKFKEKNPSIKIKTQSQRIKKCLQKKDKTNFFVNTYGLKKLLAIAIK